MGLGWNSQYCTAPEKWAWCTWLPYLYPPHLLNQDPAPLNDPNWKCPRYHYPEVNACNGCTRWSTISHIPASAASHLLLPSPAPSRPTDSSPALTQIFALHFKMLTQSSLSAMGLALIFWQLCLLISSPNWHLMTQHSSLSLRPNKLSSLTEKPDSFTTHFKIIIWLLPAWK